MKSEMHIFIQYVMVKMSFVLLIWHFEVFLIQSFKLGFSGQ